MPKVSARDREGIRKMPRRTDRQVVQWTSHIAEQRDALANWFLRRTEFTHLLMADSDMAWPADLPPACSAIGADLLGCLLNPLGLEKANPRPQ
jgi:hypothetical protein